MPTADWESESTESCFISLLFNFTSDFTYSRAILIATNIDALFPTGWCNSIFSWLGKNKHAPAPHRPGFPLHELSVKTKTVSDSLTIPSMTYLASSSCITLLGLWQSKIIPVLWSLFWWLKILMEKNSGFIALKLMPVVEIVSFSCINAVPIGDKYFSCCSSILTCQFWKHSATFWLFSLAMIFVSSRTARSSRLRPNGVTCASTSRASIPEVTGVPKHTARHFLWTLSVTKCLYCTVTKCLYCTVPGKIQYHTTRSTSEKYR